VLHSSTLKKLGTLSTDRNEILCAIVINEEMLVIGTTNQKLYIYSLEDFTRLEKLYTKCKPLNMVMLENNDMMIS